MVALDLGSNTLRIVHYDCQHHRRLSEREKVVRTAEGLHESGKIREAAIQRIIDALLEFQRHIPFDGPIIAVATAACRLADNSEQALRHIHDATGVNFSIITPEEEARLTTLAVASALQHLGHDESFLLIDIGGGSTEVILQTSEKAVSQSFPLGIVTMVEKHLGQDKLLQAIRSVCADIKTFLQEAKEHGISYKTFVATAGTPTSIAALRLGMTYKTYDPDRVTGYRLTPGDLDSERKRLLACNPEERMELVGVGREDLIIAGVLILQEFFHIVDQDECIVIDDGLREGAAIEMCRQLAPSESHA